MATTLIERDPNRAAVAHLLRRTALSVHSTRVDELADGSWDAAVTAVLSHNDGDNETAPRTNDDWSESVIWWIDRMSASDTGLTDRMAWFWHGLLTTNAWKVNEDSLISGQLNILRTNARGNFRTLLHQFVGSGALLLYLNASDSTASNPNENLACELMELFTIGRGNYSQDDVRAAARALSGWVVEDGNVLFERENAFIAPLVFLGEQADWDTDKIVDRLCDHPATAARISARLWQSMVGVPLSADGAAELGRFWQDNDLEIEPLVTRILSDQLFRDSRLNKPRTGIEWYRATRAAVGLEQESIWEIENLGQTPFLPPNVAGWPDDRRWLSPGSILARASVVHGIDMSSQPVLALVLPLTFCAVVRSMPSPTPPSPRWKRQRPPPTSHPREYITPSGVSPSPARSSTSRNQAVSPHGSGCLASATPTTFASALPRTARCRISPWSNDGNGAMSMEKATCERASSGASLMHSTMAPFSSVSR
ncbi:MAG: hypothetical protein ACI8TP_003439 [Acidimicrobiales bacterium]|jgi:uncharacterized protein (DUF1800 family)